MRFIFILLTLLLFGGKALCADLKTMLGQMVMVGFHGTSLDDNITELRRQLAEGTVGGVVFYKYNIISPAQIVTLTSGFQEIRKQSSPPILLAVDEEGGAVQRLTAAKGFEDFPSNKQTAKNMTPQQAIEQYKRLARKVKSAGFNLNFAPVADMNVNPDSPVIGKIGRSFSADPAIVVKYASEFIKAHREAGILTSIKHFPSHGSAKTDSHKGFTDITNTWSNRELAPFRDIINAGLADSVMTAHVFNKSFDQSYPATMSANTLAILRKDIGYKGVIFTDDLQMHAISENYSIEEAVLIPVLAGADILIYSNFFFYDRDFPDKAVNILTQAVQNGRLSEERVRQSYERIIKMKSRISGSSQKPKN
jgi:beta-N-acetylhexosaminidase